MPSRFRDDMKAKRSDLLSEAAARALHQRGCFELRVEDVARHAGVAKGSVYLAYPGKEALFGAALSRSCGELEAILADVVAAATDQGEALRECLNTLVRIRESRPDLAVVLEGRLPCAARWIGADASAFPQLVDALAAAVYAARGSGVVPRDVDSELASRTVFALLAFPGWYAQREEQNPVDEVDLLLRIVSSLRGPTRSN